MNTGIKFLRSTRLLLVASFIVNVSCRVRCFTRSVLYMRSDQIRPSLDDVEKISYGMAAKKRGTGSRAVPHRLNSEERTQWDLAKSNKFVILRGSGYRKERGDSPLANSYRLYCDAVAIPCISIERGLGINSDDTVFVDFSTLRTLNISEPVEKCISEANRDDEQKYTSLVKIDNRSDPLQLGWENSDVSSITEEFLTNAIWRLPSLPLIVSFRERNDSRRFAQTIVDILLAKSKALTST